MRNIILSICFIFSSVFLFRPFPVFADSRQAYQDYLYQYDRYRESLNEFKVARAEYLKFKTLVSQQTALEETKTFLQKRDDVLRAYLLFLYEKLNESSALSDSNRSLYQNLIQQEVTFLENHSALIPDVSSIADADEVSKKLSSHYDVLHANIRQTIVALKYGELAKGDDAYQDISTRFSTLLQANRISYSSEKQSTMDRWLLQIQNKRSLYAQKIEEIMAANGKLEGEDYEEVERLFQTIQKNLLEARQYLLEGTGFLNELKDAVKYID